MFNLPQLNNASFQLSHWLRRAMASLLMLTGLGLSLLLSNKAQASDQVDLLVIVEPGVYQTTSREQLHQLLTEQVAYTNKEFSLFDINYRITAVVDWPDNKVSEGLIQGKAFPVMIVPFFLPIYMTEEEYNTALPDQPEGEEYDPRAQELMDHYQADTLIFISQESQGSTIGVALHNLGAILALRGLSSTPAILAHELAHTFTLGHTSSSDCAQHNYILCAIPKNGTGFTEFEQERIRAIQAYDMTFDLDDNPMDHYLGRRIEPLTKIGRLQLSVSDSDIEVGSQGTEVTLSLVDLDGAPLVLDTDLPVQLFTEAGSATAGEHYDSDFFQNITLAAGVSEQRFDLDVEHGDSAVDFYVGARYAPAFEDSAVTQIRLAALPTDNGGGSDGGSGGSDGGSGSGSGSDSGSGSSGGGGGGSLTLIVLAALSLTLLGRHYYVSRQRKLKPVRSNSKEHRE